MDGDTPFEELPVTLLPGIGPSRSKLLAQLGIVTILDVLLYFPFRYETPYDEAAALLDGQKVTVYAEVIGAPSVRFTQAKSMVTIPVRVADRRLKAIFFNQPYIRHQATKQRIMMITGRFQARYGTIQVVSYEFPHEKKLGELAPVYRVTQNLSTVNLRKMVDQALSMYRERIVDWMPVSLLEKYKLVSKVRAIEMMHHPRDEHDVHQAKRRLIFEEFLLFQLKLQARRLTQQDHEKSRLRVDEVNVLAQEWIQTLPFALTMDQQEAIHEIAADVCHTVPMYRLLQGDVGSGKTAVIFAMVAALAKLGLQSVIMAPTSILASQHFEEAKKRLTPFGVSVQLLLGGAKNKKWIEESVAKGDADVVIGTHALLSENLIFSTLRFVVIDEQHRFGVSARRALRSKGSHGVDVLHVTATPIPRSLALTLYGDIEVTEIKTKPIGRQPITTRSLTFKDEEKVIQAIRGELVKGRQAYIVAPRIESDEWDAEAISVTRLQAQLQKSFDFWQVGLLHGQMKEVDRQEAMKSFVEGKTQVLVATSIIEVGVNVPNATVMAIYEADRFGLATLHQLRGRVGRSSYPSFCYLLADPKSEMAIERLTAMVQSQDGFELASKDLQLRGPGEAFGDRQSGLPVFHVGDPIRDLRIMEVAREVAAKLLKTGDLFFLPAYQALYAHIRDAIETLADS